MYVPTLCFDDSSYKSCQNRKFMLHFHINFMNNRAILETLWHRKTIVWKFNLKKKRLFKMTHHWKIQTKLDEDYSLYPSIESSLCAAFLLVRVRYPSTCSQLSLSHGRGSILYLCPGRVDLYDARYDYGAIPSQQYAGFWRPKRTSVVARRLQERNAAAKMTRAVLFISVFTVLLDVLHAGQVSYA